MSFFSIGPFTEDTLLDANAAVRAGFKADAIKRLEKILQNPFRSSGQSAGDIVYVNGEPVGFQAAMVRVFYVGQRRFVATVPGLLSVKKGTAPEDVLSLIEATICERNNRMLVIGNTGIPIAKQLFDFMGITGVSPDSCAHVRFAPLRIGSFLLFCSHGRLPKLVARFMNVLSAFSCKKSSNAVVLLPTIEGQGFDAFWESYLKDNDGIVFSRTEAELKWMFDEEVKSGAVLILAYRDDTGDMKGYIALKESLHTPGRWMVVDWIALKNDRKVLRTLLSDAVRALRRSRKNAFLLECIGFPDSVGDVVGSCLWFVRKTRCRVSSFKAYDPCVDEAIAAGRGWFFGPWDGDRCMS